MTVAVTLTMAKHGRNTYGVTDMNSSNEAILNGVPTTAKKIGGRWLVGGDKVEAGDVVSILRNWQGRRAWFRLTGCVLKFEDWED